MLNKDYEIQKEQLDKWKRIINEMLGEDYAKHATIKFKREDLYCLTVSFGELPIDAFNTETKQFYPSFIKLLEKIEHERIFLTKSVPITFDNLESVKKLDIFEVAKIIAQKNGVVGRLETHICTEEEEKSQRTDEYFYNFYPNQRKDRLT